jgi:sodium transport system ATP-binding protein
MIEVKNLSKTFKVPKKKKGKKEDEHDPREVGNLFHVIKDISFQSEKGAIIGLLGPNGAGKTTLLRILSTALKPSAGTALVNGVDITVDPVEVRRMIGFLSGHTGLYGRLNAKEIIAYFGQLNHIPRHELEQRRDELFEKLQITSFAHKRTDTLSTGMKQKVSIARTLIHNPEVLIFDEPTTGLDVHAAQTILAFIQECKDKGKSVIFSTHHMHEVDRLCDRVVVIDEGMKKFEGSTAAMREQTGQTHLDEAFLSLIGKLPEGVNHAA